MAREALEKRFEPESKRTLYFFELGTHAVVPNPGSESLPAAPE